MTDKDLEEELKTEQKRARKEFDRASAEGRSYDAHPRLQASANSESTLGNCMGAPGLTLKSNDPVTDL